MTSNAPLEIPTEPVANPGNWFSADFKNDNWRTVLTHEHIEEIALAVASIGKRELKAPDFKAEDFSIPKTKAFLKTLSDELESGKGFAVLRGLSTDGYTQTELENLFWGIGLHLGYAVPINASGHLLGHVTDLGFNINNPKVRNYQTTEELKFHNDTCDILGLLCVRSAKQGGRSAIASAIAIHNEILTTRPDLLAELYKPIAIDRRGERGWPGEGGSPWFALPVFSYYKGLVTARYTVHEYYFESQKFDDAPRILEKQKQALEYLKETARDPKFHFNFDLQPGDLQLLNNYCVFHSRTEFEDYPEPERKRHLLRLWLSVPNSRPLHPIFSKRFRSAKAGAIRGGIAPSVKT